MKTILTILSIILSCTFVFAQSSYLPNPVGSTIFGNSITILPNGNYIITDPEWKNGSTLNVGAVHLYDGQTDTLISSLTGSQADDQVGRGGITILTNGNYLVKSSFWNNGSNLGAGAVTWCSATTGVNGVVSSMNSLVGDKQQDFIGWDAKAMPNGDYLVRSPYWGNGATQLAGAITWGSGTTGISGVVTSSNSLVGSSTEDFIGNTQAGEDLVFLPNGNFLLLNPTWDNGGIKDAGAITFGSGTTGISGVVSSSNSLVGGSENDKFGTTNLGGITILVNGNYVIFNPYADNGAGTDAGAVTWGNGNSGVSGVASSSNSLVGTQTNDNVGRGGVTALTNGNYVISSPFWSNGGVLGVGAATWHDGNSAITGTISSSNSLIGSTAQDNVSNMYAGYGKPSIVALTNGNYVVASSNWKNGSIYTIGAVTWCDGTTGRTGLVSSANSLVGSPVADNRVGKSVVALTNGNYVVSSMNWGTGLYTAYFGAVTWCNGNTGLVATVSSANSLVGSNVYDYVGNSITPLPNGNYVVNSPGWKNGTFAKAGAVTWCDGNTGLSGVVSSSNSLVGSLANDQVGTGGITVLTNGNYVIVSSYCANGSALYAGAITWGSATSGLSGVVNTSNSLMGGQLGCFLGYGGATQMDGLPITALSNGNYVVNSPGWRTGSFNNVGAVTWCNGSTGTTGVVSSTNSLVGSQKDDYVGYQGVKALNNGGYVVNSYKWNNGSIENAGAVTWGNPDGGTSGVLNSANSLVGGTAYDQVGQAGINVYTDGNYVIKINNWDSLSRQNVGAITLGNGATGVSGLITSCNSLIGPDINFGFYFRYGYSPDFTKLIAGTETRNFAVVYSPFQTAAALSNNSASNTTTGNNPLPFVSSSCDLIAALTPSGSQPVSGEISATVTVTGTAPSYNGTVYVRRSYDITPASNGSTATATVTLYFTQADFDDYNANNGPDPDLPTQPNDAAGKANLRINQQHGTSATSTFGTYTGWGGSGPSSVIITPSAEHVNWNAGSSRWEVTFPVDGFSGFFITGNNGAPLPIQLVSFTAKAQGSRNLLNWETAFEPEGTTYEVTRSTDGRNFENLGIVSVKKKAYEFYDEKPIWGINYYRINIVASSGKKIFSNIAIVRTEEAGSVSVWPTPVNHILNISCNNERLIGSTIQIVDIQGRSFSTIQLSSENKIDVSQWQSGIYILKFEDGKVMKIVKE